ncbi:CoA transferase [Streptosporangium amethystogenes subsp. fukuiense]|uniref:CoA transferase n=1 Tax=Streptosporangium amethystogenes subsp. fukuiense TaxID=698418 RepID=A0ABW2STR7_9ACTN
MEAEQMPGPSGSPAGPLAGIVVVGAATLFAGPPAATTPGDHGADVVKVADPEQHVLFGLSDTPGPIRWTGRVRGTDNAGVRGDLGVSADELDAPRERKVA